MTIWHAVDGSQSGYPAATVPNPSASGTGGGANLGVSPDGRTLATGANDGSVRLWNLPAGLATRSSIPQPAGRVAGTPMPANQTGTVAALGFTPNGMVHIAFATGDVLTWNFSGQPTPTFHVAPVSNGGDSLPTAALSPDGTTIAFATSSTVQLWDMATGQSIGDPIAPGDGTIFNLAFSPNGGTLATGGGDGTVRPWNVSYLTPVGALAELCARIRPIMPMPAWTATDAGPGGLSYQRACATHG